MAESTPARAQPDPFTAASNARVEKQQKAFDALEGITIPVKRRSDPFILPTDDDWIQVEDAFKKMLRDPRVTTGAILNRFFDDYDQRIFMPVVSPPTQVDVQKDHTMRYNTLLATRFKEHALCLATKFAMLYFRLPVEPLMAQLFDPMRHIVEETDESGLEAVTVRPPLHFLTAHDQRNFGLEAKRGREAAFSTVPVQRSERSGTSAENAEEPVLGLRGGVLDDEDLVEHFGTSAADTEEPVLGLRGGDLDDGGVVEHFGKSFVEAPQEDTSMGGTEPAVHDPAMRAQLRPLLLGYQGCCEVSFFDYYGIFDSIRALLSVQTEVTTDIVLHKIEDGKITATWTLPDAETAYTDTILLIQQHTEMQAQQFFIHRIGEEPPQENHFRPMTREDDVFKLKCVVRERTWRESYIRLPPKAAFWPSGSKKHNFGVNDFMNYIKTAQSVLHDRSLFPGDVPHAIFHLEGFARGSDEMLSGLVYAPGAETTTWSASYGGIELDKTFLDFSHQSIENGPISAQFVREDLGDHQIALYIPGALIRPDRLVLDIDEPTQGKVVLDRLREFFQEVGDIDEIKFYHGRNFYDPNVPATFTWWPLKTKKRAAWPPNDAVLNKIYQTVRQNTSTGRYFVLQPCYVENSKTSPASQSESKVDLSQALESVEAFHAMVGKYHDGDTTLCDVVLEQLGKSKHWKNPKYVVRGSADDDELRRIRRHLSAQHVQFRVVTDRSSSFARSLAAHTQTVFGPRYGLIDETERQLMGLEPLPSQDDPRLVKLRRDWAAKQKKAAAADAAAVAALKRKEDADTSKSFNSLPRKQQDIFKKRIPKKNLRLQSWSRPQSLYDGDGSFHPYIPQNSAPIESLLRVGKGQSVPTVSRGVLTPSEQRQLQREVHTLRNLTLRRIQLCQYQDCSFQCRSDDTKALVAHQKSHLKYRCPWCPEELFEHYHEKSRDDHMKEKHGDKLARLAQEAVDEERVRMDPLTILTKSYVPPPEKQKRVDPRGALHTMYSRFNPRPPGVKKAMPPPGKAHAFETEYSHCDRCGRNHGLLDDKRDRAHHDRLCVPHAAAAGDCGFCKNCGEREWNSRKDANKWDVGVDIPHRCRGLAYENSPHCQKCGLSMASMTDAYIDKHRKHCMGYGSMVASFCPYCCLGLNGIHPGQQDTEMWLKHKRMHITACRRTLRPAASQRAIPGDTTPFDLYDEAFWAGPEPPHDDLWHGPQPKSPVDISKQHGGNRMFPFKPSKLLGEELAWYEQVGEKEFQDPPLRCTEKDCGWSFGTCMPTAIFNHYVEKHGDDLKTCPFCSLSFMVPAKDVAEGGERYEHKYKMKHLECHVFELWDIRDGKKKQPNYDGDVPPHDVSGDPDKVRCPRFRQCGAIVGNMNKEQWETHYRKMHPQLLQCQTMESMGSYDLPPLTAFQLGKPPKKGNKSSQPADTSGQSTDVEMTGTAEPGEEAELTPIGSPPPGFVLKDRYCSRCFRPVSIDDWDEDRTELLKQMKEHMYAERGSCHIPWGPGKAMQDGKVILPNRSGWIHKNDVPATWDWAEEAAKFEAEFPALKGTFYGFIEGEDLAATRWARDPNNTIFKDKWSIEFPPAGYDPLKGSAKPVCKPWPKPGPKPDKKVALTAAQRELRRLEEGTSSSEEESEDSEDEDEDEDQDDGDDNYDNGDDKPTKGSGSKTTKGAKKTPKKAASKPTTPKSGQGKKTQAKGKGKGKKTDEEEGDGESSELSSDEDATSDKKKRIKKRRGVGWRGPGAEGERNYHPGPGDDEESTDPDVNTPVTDEERLDLELDTPVPDSSSSMATQSASGMKGKNSGEEADETPSKPPKADDGDEQASDAASSASKSSRRKRKRQTVQAKTVVLLQSPAPSRRTRSSSALAQSEADGGVDDEDDDDERRSKRSRTAEAE